MPRGIPDTSSLVSTEGQEIILDFQRTSDTTGTLSWVIPTFNGNIRTYDGILVTGSIKETNPSNFPTDDVRYVPSTDFSVPADTIGNAQVMVALYGDRTTVSMPITGLVANVVYYFSAHLVTSVLSYFTLGVRSFPQNQNNEVYAGDIATSYGPPLNPVIGQVYFDEIEKTVYFYNGSIWAPTALGSTLSGIYDPVAPFVGLPTGYPALGHFFYNTRLKILKCWNGTEWIEAESKLGQPTYMKPDVGTTNTYTARSNLIDVLKHQLGYPVVCVELTEDHFNIAIDNALMEIRHRVDSSFNREYFFLTIQPDQDKYYFNDPVIGTNRVVDVLKIHRINNLGLGNFAPDNIYAQQFLTQFYAPGVGYDLVSIHLIHSMSETFSKVFAGDIAFNWREASREMRIYRRFARAEKVLIETSCEKPEQEILLDRWMQQWVQAWSLSEAMMMLARIRGKFQNLPGPGGSLSLNADSLLAEAQKMQEDCLREVMDMEVGQNGPDNFYMPFAIG